MKPGLSPCMALLASAASHLLPAESQPVFRPVEIDDAIEIGYGLAIADVNGDGKPDVLLADKRQFVWYENPNWQKRILAENVSVHDNVCLAALDRDEGGKAEIAVGADWNPSDTTGSGAVFYLTPPADRNSEWEPVALYHEPTVHRMRWVKTTAGEHQLVVVPLHGRGNRDGQGVGVRILAYKKPLDPKQPWVTELIDDSLHLTHNFCPTQWDGDLAEELLVAAKEGVFLFDRRDAKWERTQLAGNRPGETGFEGAGEVRTGKLEGGARFFATIEPMHGSRVVIYTAPDPHDESRLWRRSVIDESLVDGHALVIGDFIKAGYDQVVVGWRAMNKPDAGFGLRWYGPQPGSEGKWQQATVDDRGMACEDLAIADLNGDGRIDLVASGRGTRNVKIYFNETPGIGNR